MTAPALQPDRIWLGTCAWSFDDWRDVFYPHDLPHNRWLRFYADHFRAVEMDSSFHHVPSAHTVGHWEELVGPGFRFCPKLPRSLSHDKRMEHPAPEIAMMENLADELGPHLGCALLQLPPSFRAHPYEEKMLRAFLRAWPAHVPLAMEFRDGSWEAPRTARLLEDHGVAWVWADTLPVEDEKHAGFGFFPTTAPHIYVRLLGDFRTKYGPNGHEAHRCDRLLWPRDIALGHWVSKLRNHASAQAIWIFASNHYEGMAVETIRRLAPHLGVDLPRREAASAQLDLFDGAGGV